MHDPCINEKKRLLQECLPGVTLHNSNDDHYYDYHHPLHHSRSRSHDIDQLQNHIMISNSINNNKQRILKNSEKDSNGDLNKSMDEASIHILWIDNNNNDDKYNDYDFNDDDDDDMTSSSFSLRRAAAISAATRRSEQRWIMYFKLSLFFVFFLLLWDQFQPITTTTNNNNNNNNNNAEATTSEKQKNHNKESFRLYKYWNWNNNIQDGGRNNDDERREILVALKDLDEAIHGDIVLRSNKTKFVNAASVWQRQDSTSSISSPLAVIDVTNVDDVQIAIPILAGLARDYKLKFRIRSGGHSYMNGYSTINNGVMLNLAKLNTISPVNTTTILIPNNKNVTAISNDNNHDNTAIAASSTTTTTTSISTVIIGPGVRVEDFMKNVLDEHGYSGIVASAGGVGMGGFILGGGYGLQSRMYGLAIDNVVSLNVVLASGESRMDVTKDTDDDSNDNNDLFWALRGSGGGNIGVVTSFKYRVYPSLDIKLAATVTVPLEEMTQFIQRLGDKEPNLAPEFTLTVQGYKTPENNRTSPGLFQHLTTSLYEQNVDEDKNDDGLVTISMFWMGDSNPENPVGMQYIKENVIPLFSNNSTIDNVVYYYFSWSGMSREREQDGSWKSVWSAQSWNGFLLPQNNTQEIWTDIQSSLSAMFKYCKYVTPKVELWGGAISKISSNATAFPHRNAVYNIGIELLVPTENDADAANDEMHLVNAIWPSIARHLDGVYVNYPMASLSNESYPTAYWGKNLKRLKELKQRYDPTYALNVSQSIPIL